ncbi:hypothetical protein [Xanthocytophaga agilis]|uniref:Uncharacterized protein n=1 Tax=Xanthocytophaga agilis TaxID=3048010 RepID=A0AAE3UIW4_9BACT|nr:hypothetical protein [Xanthocytophaga agilis]MDJ1504992.1 hypothetical protein [Xanthocytophaga agilis]
MRLIIWILILMLIGFGTGLIVKKCATKKQFRENGRHYYTSVSGAPWMPDTVKRLHIDPIQPTGKLVIPVQTDIALVADTALRKSLEKKDIIIGVKHLPKPSRKERRRARRIKKDTLMPVMDLLVIQTISPIGKINTNQYPARWIQPGKWEITPQGLHIDSTAFRKRKRLFK